MKRHIGHNERIKEAMKQLQNPPELIEKVNFTLLRKIDGECARCGDETDVMEIVAMIYFRDPKTNKMVESIFNYQWCQWCINDLLGLQQEENEIQNLYT